MSFRLSNITMAHRKQFNIMVHAAKRVAGKLDQLILLPMFALLLLAALWAGAYYQVDQERKIALRDILSNSQALARTFAEHCVHILNQADHAMQLFKVQFEERDGKFTLSNFIRKDGVMKSVLPYDIDLLINIYDKEGNLIESTQPFDADNISNLGYFKNHAAHPLESMTVSKPIIDSASKKWTIHMSRRLNFHNGLFAGVITIKIDPAYFIDDYDATELGPQGVVMLLSPDEKLSVRRIGEQVQASNRIEFSAKPTGDQVAVIDDLALETPFKVPFDTVPRLYGARQMVEYALVALVGLPEEHWLTKRSGNKKLYFWASSVATMLICAFVGLLMYQSYRLRTSMKAAREAQATLRAAADGSIDAFYILKCCRNTLEEIEDFEYRDMNQRGADFLGLSRWQILGQKLCVLHPFKRSQGYFARYVQVVESGETLEQELEIHEPEIKAKWLHYQVVTIGDGVAVTIRDITERKRVELETRANRGFLQSLIDYLPVLVLARSARPDNFGEIMVWNKTAEIVTGYPAGQLLGKTSDEAFPADVATFYTKTDAAMLANPMVIDIPEQPILRPDGNLRYLHSVSVPLFDDEERTEYILSIAEDITGRREQELQLRQKQAELVAVNDASPLGLVRSDRRGVCTYVNRTFEEISGLAREHLHGDGWLAAIHPDDRAKIFQAMDILRQTKKPHQEVFRFCHDDGKIVWASVKIAVIVLDGVIDGYVGSVDDITTRREAEIALHESEARLRTIANSLPAMVAYIDAEQRYRFHNLAYERELGFDVKEIHGKTLSETLAPERYAFLLPYIDRVLDGETLTFEDEQEMDGAYSCMEVTYIPQYSDDDQRTVGFHVMSHSITAQKLEARRLVKLSQVDALTGLTNRAGFNQRLADAMQRSQQSRFLMAVMYLDIDRFKPVNDTYGHDVGDALLKAFSQRLTNTLRSSDTVARLGGDEFTIIMEMINKTEDAATIAGKIVNAMRKPFELNGLTVHVSSSIGVAFYQGGVQGPEALLKQADVMLYRSKQAGRDTFSVAEFEVDR